MVAEPGMDKGVPYRNTQYGSTVNAGAAGVGAPGAADAGGGAPSGDAAVKPGRDRLVTSHRAVLVVALTSLCLIVLDIGTKLLAVAQLTGRAPIEIIPGVLDLRLTRNSGAAFSLAGGATVILSLIALAVVAVVVVTARRLASIGWAFVFGAMVGGALGNLIDRLFRAPGPLRGHVVDFVHIHHWPIFNVADSAIVCGGVLAVILSLRGIGLDGTRLSAAPPPDPGSAEPAGPSGPAGPSHAGGPGPGDA
ncbi:signal peptidase II [Parafrankia sp. FMc6]|nr:MULTISPECIES: signal peptidase II [Parafrankia]